MPTPTNRVPVRVARGNIATLTASIDQLFEGEIVYAVDEKTLYAVDSGQLISVAGDGVNSVNGQTGNVLLGVEQLIDVDLTGVANGDMLIYQNGEWVNIPATAGGTVYSVDVTGDNAITATGGPITNTGSISLSLEPTGVTAGQYTLPSVTVDAQGRITDIEAGVAPDQDLNDLQDVNAPTPGIGDGLIWNGVNWINTPDVGGGAEDLGDLNDVNLDDAPPLDGQALVYDIQTATWKPGTVTIEPEPVELALGDLTNVDVPTVASDRFILQYSASKGLWEDKKLFVNSINDIRDFDVYGEEYGDILVWDGSDWVAGYPNTVGPIALDSYTTTPEESPLLGGDRLLPDAQAWEDLGFVLASDRDPLNGFSLDRFNQQIRPRDFGYSNLEYWKAFGHRVPGIENFTLEMGYDDVINIGRHKLNFNKPGNDYFDQQSQTWSVYDYVDDAENASLMEISIFIQDIADKNMDLYRAGVCPAHYDEDGTMWTIIRRELVSALSVNRNFAIEHWFGSEGQLFTKVSPPSWGFNWTTGTNGWPRAEFEHGIYFLGQRVDEGTNCTPRSLEGYGHLGWTNTPRRGGYVNFIGPVEQRPPLPLDQYNLGELGDVDTTGAAVDDILQYDGTNWIVGQLPEAPEPPEVPDELSDLNDVDTAGAQPGQALLYDGSEWQPGDLPSPGTDLSNASLDDIGDVNAPAPSIGQLLQWNGSEWVPADAPQSGAGSLDDLTDVNVTTPAPEDTQVLAYNQSDDEWQAANPRATAGAPTATTFPGLPGEMRYSETHFYICIAPNTWKEVELQAIGGGGTPDPELGDIADGGDFLNGIEGTINTILDGGNWTNGISLDQENVEFDGGYFTPEPIPEPQPGDAIDGGNFQNGTSNGTNFYVDGGNFTTGAPGQGDNEQDGGVITPELPGPDEIIDGGDFEDGTSEGGSFSLDGGNFTIGQGTGPDATLDGGFFTGNIPGSDDVIDGGDFNDGTPGTDFRVDGGDFTTGAAGGPDVVLDGGFFSPELPGPNDSIDGGNWEFGFSNGSNFYLDGGNFTTGQNGPGGIADGGFWSDIVLPGPDDTINGGDFETGAGGTEFYLDGGNFTTGANGTGGEADGGYWSEIVIPGPDEIIDGGDFETGAPGTDFRIDGGHFTTGESGTDGTIDGGNFTEDVAFDGVDGGNFTTGAAGADREVVDGGQFTFGWVIDDSPADGGDFTIPLDGSDDGTLDGGEFEI